MRGSVHRSGDGWAFVVDGGVDPGSGKRRQIRRRGFRTKKEAAEALANLIADRSRGMTARPARVTLLAFLIDEWLPARRSTLRDTTAASYEQMIRNYIAPHVGAAQLKDVDGAMLTAFYNQLASNGRTETRRKLGPGLSAKSIRNVHGLLKTAMKDAVLWGRLNRNPCDAARPPRKASPEMAAWSADEMRRFLQAVSSHRWSGVWTLMATTGLRRGEILGLRWRDVDLDAATVTIRSTRVRFGTSITESTPKTDSGRRTIAIGPATVAALRQWKRQQNEDRLAMGAGWPAHDLLVTLADGSAPNPEAFSNLFKKLSADVGLPAIRLHDLRHSYATAALAAGVPVKVLSQRIGHADVGVTLKVYAHVLPGDDESAAMTADKLVGLL